MDPLTHALSGAVIKNLGFKRKASLGVLMVSTLAPDLDFLTGFWGADVMLRYHRGITHGLLALVVFPVLVGLVFRKKGGFLYYWFLAALGYGSHIALDYTNGYGTRFLAPMDWQTYSAGLTFMVEPLVIAGFAISLLIAWMKPERGRAAVATALILLAIFIGAKQHYRDRAEEFLRTSMDEHIVKTIAPMPNSIMRWWFVAQNDREISTGFADLFTEKVYIHKTYPRNIHNRFVERSKDYELVKNFLFFAQYPYAEAQKNGNIHIVKWRELACAYSPREMFTATLAFGEDGKLINSKIRL